MNTNDNIPAPVQHVVGCFHSCPICLMPMDISGECVRHDVDEINKYIDGLRNAWADIKRTVDSCDSGVGLFIKNRMLDWEKYFFTSHDAPNPSDQGAGAKESNRG